MDNKLRVKNTILISAPIEKVWDALVNPEQTKKYMFGCEAISDWSNGSDLLWKGIYQGKEMIFVKGIILQIQPGKLLQYTVIDPNSSMPDIPQNYLNVTYELTEKDGKTCLSVCQDGFENAADGEKRYKDVYNNGEGWHPILIEIKKILESN
jgi:uncharacterized protein YndB with AHSA1/START domain